MITKTGTLFIKEAARNTAGLQALENRLVQFQNNPDALDNEPEMEISLGSVPVGIVNDIREMYGAPKDFVSDGEWYANNKSVKHFLTHHIAPRRRSQTSMTPSELTEYTGRLIDSADNGTLGYVFEYSPDTVNTGKTRRDFLVWEHSKNTPTGNMVPFAAVRNPATGRLRIHSLYKRDVDNIITNKVARPRYTPPANTIITDPD